uniref:BTB domain-containing protein n=1 Tax=Ditylenchus dipsaci TaxID=166011 RepID=A0A915D0B9_9BILA
MKREAEEDCPIASKKTVTQASQTTNNQTQGFRIQQLETTVNDICAQTSKIASLTSSIDELKTLLNGTKQNDNFTKKILIVHFYVLPLISMNLRIVQRSSLSHRKASKLQELNDKLLLHKRFGWLGWDPYVAWSELTDGSNALVDQNGNFVIEAEFFLQIKSAPSIGINLEFLTTDSVQPDFTFVVQGNRIPVIKALLSACSVPFRDIFCKSSQDEIELNDLIAAEFVHLLRAIYPSADPDKDVNGNNVECLLRLANFFQVKIVTKRCIIYLMKGPIKQVPREMKLLLAQNYNQPILMDYCIGQYKSMKGLEKFIASSQYRLLNSDIKLRVQENVSKAMSS